MWWLSMTFAFAQTQDDSWRSACAHAVDADVTDGAAERTASGWTLHCAGHQWNVASVPADPQARLELLWVLLARATQSRDTLGLPPPPPAAPPRLRSTAVAPVPSPAVTPPSSAPPPSESPVAPPPESPVAPPSESPVPPPSESPVPPPSESPVAPPARVRAPPHLAVGGWGALGPTIGARRATWLEVRSARAVGRLAVGRSGELLRGSTGYYSSVDVAAGLGAEWRWLRVQLVAVASWRTAHGWGARTSTLIPGISADALCRIPFSRTVGATFGLRTEADLRRTELVLGRGTYVLSPVAMGGSAGVVVAVGGER